MLDISTSKVDPAGKPAKAGPEPRLGNRSRRLPAFVHPASFCTAGLLLGTIFFAFSLSPSLVPRGPSMQGILSGLSLGAGYGLGAFGRWLWGYLELPTPRERAARQVKAVASSACGLTVAFFLWQAAEWQNSVRLLMGMGPVDTAHPFRVGLIAIVVFGALVALGRLFAWTIRRLSARFQKVVPRRVANVLGILTAAALFWSLIDGVIFSAGIRATDWSYQQVDAVAEDDLPPPVDPMWPGSPVSLLGWEALGRQGRQFIAATPGTADLQELLEGEEAMAPRRVYVGLNSAEDPAARASLALAELERVGGFDRSILVIITPTGTGWVDPAAIETLESLHRGDVASIAVQYSYLPSWLALLVEADYGAATAQALFEAVYEHWRALPDDDRPELYLHGLSLGALNSDRSFEPFDIVGDPFQGALWAGPPFRTETWSSVTQRRDAASPAWLPVFRDGAVVRFANQEVGLDVLDGTWRAPRIAFLQHASDPVTFFEPRALYREPEWMAIPRGPDVSPALRWFPVVTMLQLAADMIAGSEPVGYGHEYAAEDYVEAWIALTEPDGWDPPAIERLKAAHAARRCAVATDPVPEECMPPPT